MMVRWLVVIVIVMRILMLVPEIFMMVANIMQVQRSDTREDISFSAGQEPVGDRKDNGTTCEIYH